jgi:predicted acetyltransferase
MTIDVRFLKEGELPRMRDVLATAFGGGDPNSDWDETWQKAFEQDRLIVATEGSEIVGVGGSFSFTMTVPGAELPTAGLTVVGVLPTHRRKGILRKLMAFHLEDARGHDEPLSILWASEEAIYQRFGYGLASQHHRIELETGYSSFRNDPGPSGRLRLITEEESLKVLPDIYERVRRGTPGMLARHADWWKYHRLFDPKSGREGASHQYRLVWENDGEAEGYALYRVKEDWDETTGLPQGEARVSEVITTTPTAHREVWRYLASLDLVKTTTAFFVAVDDPIKHMMLRPRRLRVRWSDALWLRVVDLKATLEGRAYAADGSITFDLEDTFVPANNGRWTLTVSDGKGQVQAATGDPDLAFDAGDLGATYLGGTSFTELVRAGRVQERDPGAAARADSLFRSDKAPWNPEIF